MGGISTNAVSRLRLEAFRNKNYNLKCASPHPCKERKDGAPCGLTVPAGSKAKGYPLILGGGEKS
jgi:hypothetical protein